MTNKFYNLQTALNLGRSYNCLLRKVLIAFLGRSYKTSIVNELTHAMFCMFPPSVNWRGTQYVLAVIEKRRGRGDGRRGEERERDERGEGI